MKNISYPRIYIYKQIVEAKLYIDAHFKNNIDLGIIAHHASLSKFHFHRIFKDCYHRTPLEYLTYKRVQEAKKLLSEGFSSKEVCHMVGYESISSFIKLFKKREKFTPVAYAKRIKEKQLQTSKTPLNFIPSSYAAYLGWNK